MNQLTSPVLAHLTVLADPLRARLLLVLEGQTLAVGELCDILQLPQSTISRHLKTLTDGGWSQVRREGTFLWYSANAAALQELLGFLYAECCTRNKAVEPQKVVCCK